jgi:uncharacterized zinc-type alcohol dehydrogenase-like protein
MIKGYAAMEPGGRLQPFEFDPGPLKDNEVEIKVEYCGLCHSDLSILDNEFGITQYPLVPGHEIVGTVTALGSAARGLKEGQRVGVGWFAESDLTCEWTGSGSMWPGLFPGLINFLPRLPLPSCAAVSLSSTRCCWAMCSLRPRWE